MTTFEDINEQITVANNLGIRNLSEKGVEVSEPVTTYKIMENIEKVSGGGGDGESFIKALIEKNEDVTELPDYITSIGANMFNSHSNIAISELPDSVTTIGDYSFTRCPKITNIRGNCVTRFGTGAFGGCNNIVTAYFPRLSHVSNYSFQNNTSLKTLTLGVVSYMHTNSLVGCTALEDLTTGNGIKTTLYLQHCSSLTQASRHGIIDNLADMTGKTAPTITVHENCRGIDQTHLDRINALNWIHNFVLAEG